MIIYDRYTNKLNTIYEDNVGFCSYILNNNTFLQKYNIVVEIDTEIINSLYLYNEDLKYNDCSISSFFLDNVSKCPDLTTHIYGIFNIDNGYYSLHFNICPLTNNLTLNNLYSITNLEHNNTSFDYDINLLNIYNSLGIINLSFNHFKRIINLIIKIHKENFFMSFLDFTSDSCIEEVLSLHEMLFDISQ